MSDESAAPTDGTATPVEVAVAAAAAESKTTDATADPTEAIKDETPAAQDPAVTAGDAAVAEADDGVSGTTEAAPSSGASLAEEASAKEVVEDEIQAEDEATLPTVAGDVEVQVGDITPGEVAAEEVAAEVLAAAEEAGVEIDTDPEFSEHRAYAEELSKPREAPPTEVTSDEAAAKAVDPSDPSVTATGEVAREPQGR